MGRAMCQEEAGGEWQEKREQCLFPGYQLKTPAACADRMPLCFLDSALTHFLCPEESHLVQRFCQSLFFKAGIAKNKKTLTLSGELAGNYGNVLNS